MPNLKNYRSLALSLLAASGALFCAIHAIGLQHEWGYGAVRDLVGQENGLGQSIQSAIMRTLFIAPMISGLTFGYLKRHFQGGNGWRAISALIPAGLLALSVIDGGADFQELLKPESLLFTGGLFSLFYLAMFAGEKVFAELSSRTRAWPILLPGLLALVPMMVLNQFDFMCEDGSSWMLEAVVDGFFTFGAALCACRWNGCKTLGTALTVAFLSAIPFILANTWNVGSDLLDLAISRSHDSLDAQLSAVLISLWSMLATLAGASAGLLWNRRAAS